MGDLAFSAGVLFINIKLLILELHNKTLVTFIGFFLSVGGWFLWNLILAEAYKREIGPYSVHGAFLHRFGKMPLWWLTLIMVLIMVIVLELAVTAVRRVFWPHDQDLMQEVEKRLGAASLLGADDSELGDTYDEDQGFKPSWGWRVPENLRHWGKRRPSKKVSGDVYMAPPFVTSPLEEQVANPTDEDAVPQTKSGKKGTVTSVSAVKPDECEPCTDGTMSGAVPSGSGKVHSPVELLNSNGRGHGS